MVVPDACAEDPANEPIVIRDTAELADATAALISERLDVDMSLSAVDLRILFANAIWAELSRHVDGEQVEFSSLEEEQAFLNQIVASVAESIRAQANSAIDTGTRALIAAKEIDGRQDCVDPELVRPLSSDIVTRLAIRASRTGDIKAELLYRQMLNERPDISPKNRILNLYNLKELYLVLSDSDSIIATNEELIEFIECLGTITPELEEKIGLNIRLGALLFRAHDSIFVSNFQRGTPLKDEAIGYYSGVLDGHSLHVEAKGTSLRRLRKIHQSMGDNARSLDYALGLARHEFGRPHRKGEARRSLERVYTDMEAMGIDFNTLGQSLDNDLGLLTQLGPVALRELLVMAEKRNHYRAQVSILEALLTKEMRLPIKIKCYEDIIDLYELGNDPLAKLAVIERYVDFLNQLDPEDFQEGCEAGLASRKFRAVHEKYKTQIQSNEKLGDKACFDPEDRQHFYEDNLLIPVLQDAEKAECLLALSKIYEENGEGMKAYNCANVLLGMDVSYLYTSRARQAEIRLGDTLSLDERAGSKNAVMTSI
ncbi:MAG: hypothetical protein O3B47_05315, partial [bacterium]|nr:hypothetical protein [bacterium]